MRYTDLPFRRRDAAVIVVVVALTTPRRLLAAPSPPQPSTHIADYAHLIDATTAARLDGWLTELEQKTTAQVVVLTVNSLGGLPIEKFTIELMGKWKLGQKGKDNGVLVCVASRDRKYRIEVGYGLEGALPDSWCGSVAREYFVPNFRRGAFGKGIYEGTLAVANKVAEEYHVSISGLPARSVRPNSDPAQAVTLFILLLSIFVLVSVLRQGRRRRRGGFWRGWAIGNMMSGNWSSGSWSSGSSGGWSSGGSFGGGGGGSFGGGGASGGW